MKCDICEAEATWEGIIVMDYDYDVAPGETQEHQLLRSCDEHKDVVLVAMDVGPMRIQ